MAAVTLLLGADRRRLGETLGGQFLDPGFEFRVGLRHHEFALGHADQFLQLKLHIDQRLQGTVAEEDRLEHVVLGDQVGLPLDHHHRVAGAGDDDFDIAFGHLLQGRIGDQLAADPADAHRGDRSGEGDVRDDHGGRSRHHRQGVGIVDQVGGNHRRHDLGFKHVALGKEGPHRPVDQPADQGFALGGPALATEERAGDLPRGVELLLVIDGEREETLPFAHLPGRDRGAQHLGFAVGDDGGAVGLARHFPRFDGQGLTVEIDFDLVISHEILLSARPLRPGAGPAARRRLLSNKKWQKEDGLRQDPQPALSRLRVLSPDNLPCHRQNEGQQTLRSSEEHAAPDYRRIPSSLMTIR